MPLYSYRCQDGHEFDAHVKIDGSDAPKGCVAFIAYEDAERMCSKPVQKVFALTARAFPGAGSWRKGMSSER